MGALSHQVTLLFCAALAVIGLIVAIARFKIHAFVSLIVASLFVGICSGTPLIDIAKAFQEGVGALLGSIAMVVGLGTILGKLLAESGGAEIIAARLIQILGRGRLHWTMMIVAFLIGIPVFFAVGLVLLAPVLFTLARETKLPFLFLAMPMAAGLSIVHGLVPPHPGPMAAIGILKADPGKTIFYALAIGFPTAIVSGPLFGSFIAQRVPVPLGGLASQLKPHQVHPNPPGFALALVTVLLPVLLMLSATIADLTLPARSDVRQWIDFIGTPLVSMLAACIFSFYSFGFARGFGAVQILKFSEECLAPVAPILLVVGAGGGFNKVLGVSGVGDAIAGLVKDWTISPLFLGWLMAALIRVATGSATVAITTAAGLVAPVLKAHPTVDLELLVVAMGAGSLILSHLNDGGFWFVKEYFNLTVPQTLKTWTVMETLSSVVALLLVLLCNAAIHNSG